MDDVVKELVDMLSDHVCCVFPQTTLLTILLVAFIFFKHVSKYSNHLPQYCTMGRNKRFGKTHLQKTHTEKLMNFPLGFYLTKKGPKGPACDLSNCGISEKRCSGTLAFKCDDVKTENSKK